MKKPYDIAGMRFGRLTAVRIDESHEGKRIHWICKCDCGKEKSVRASHMKSGMCRSCGCLSHDRGGKSLDLQPPSVKPLYRVWRGMIDRCRNPNAPNYCYYGEKGITVCDRWKSFDEFAKDMGERPDGTTLDRIDSNGNYCPENCRWATATEQSRNRSWARNLTIYGLTMSVSAWSEISGIPSTTIIGRLDKGVPEKLAVFTPSIKKGRGSANWGKKNAV
jgi:hypothetical protein